MENIQTISEMKIQAKRLREILRIEFNKEVSQSSSLHIMAFINGYKNWNTASAILKKSEVIK